MDKNAIKKYAVWARRELIARVSQKALQYGITAEDCGDTTADSINGTLLTKTEKKQRQALIAQIEEKGYQEVMEEVAYTWFNRFSALRFMEVNGYLPSHVRVFTDDENNFKPQIITEAIHLEMDGLDMEKVYVLKDANRTDELYKYLLITQCNALSSILPGMFQRIEDFTELLFPDNILREGSVIEQMIKLIPEEDWKDAVQIIGWLYQYYNSEKKDEVFAALKKNVKITKDNIPAATQLFTPDWIVRYMVENSLGRLWIEGHPNDALKSTWKYYLDEAEQEPDVQKKLAEIRKEYAGLKPEDIKCIDPCMGSGHILAYMFDVLMQIYEAYGYSSREAVESIVKNNLYGLDIDDRAAQLANFAVMMKARQYDRRFFSRGIQPHVYSIVESNHVDSFTVDYFANGDAKLTKAIKTIIEELHDAKEYGSILTVTQQDWNALYARFDEIREDINISREAALNELLPLVRVAQNMAQKYHVVSTNPPYLSSSNMNQKLSKFIQRNYPNVKNDLFASFIANSKEKLLKGGYAGLLSPYVWMFLQSYEPLRHFLVESVVVSSLIQFEYSAFEEATVPICSFVYRNVSVNAKCGFIRLSSFKGGMSVQKEKVLTAAIDKNCGYYFEVKTKRFLAIPTTVFGYWINDNALKAFEQAKKLSDIADVKVGLQTGDNNRFLRYWYEVEYSCITFNSTDGKNIKWAPHNKAGEFRKWAGNRDYIVNWENEGAQIKACSGARPQNVGYYFKHGFSWSDVSSGSLGVRFYEDGTIFNTCAPTIFPKQNNMYLLALLNSKIGQMYMDILAPTLHYNAGSMMNFPVWERRTSNDFIDVTVTDNIELSCKDWDSFETSWDFKKHPLIRTISTASEAFSEWSAECDKRFSQLKANEEELNRIFIDIYGLQDELTPEVEEKDVTVRKADLQRDVKSFISYAVGCMFGRYSLDVEGLAYAGGEWDASKYRSFPADKDNIIPICDDEYFEDDIVGRFIEFVKVVYGEDSLEANLQFIADALGGKGSSREVIRNYFRNDFYSDHCKMYQKRPIYWLFDSGKKGGFKALIYMHRYQPDTIARMRTDYVHEQQARYRTAIDDLQNRIAGASASERVRLNKQLTKLKDQGTEIHAYEEKMHHLADQMIRIDLDDGVKYNYEIFKDVLAKIK